MKLGIVIPTYQRNDGKSPEFLKRALESIKNQIYQNYVVFLIGDKYNDNVEFELLATTIIEKNKIKYINLLHAVEREKYLINSNELCLAGSSNANNVGIDMAISEGISYVCHLDHDDYWENNHLFEINNFIENNKNCVFITTTATRINTNIVAPLGNGGIHYPYTGSVYHSATCVDFSRILLRYRDVFACTGKLQASDADLWNRISEYMRRNKLIGYHINKITSCHTSHHIDTINQ